MKIKEQLFYKIPDVFICPITGVKPTNEVQISGLIGLFWQRNLIDWDKVNLYSAENHKDVKIASELFKKEGLVNCEYPLFAETADEIKNYGGMTADLVYITEQQVVLVENKIGSNFTYGGTQLDRQANFLNGSRMQHKALILLTSEMFVKKGWYIKELEAAASKYKVKGYVMCLEGIFKGITS